MNIGLFFGGCYINEQVDVCLIIFDISKVKMKYQCTKTLYTVLVVLFIVIEGHGTTQHQPSNMQTKKIDIYTASATNINAELYSFPY